MTDLEPQIAHVLDQHRPPIREEGDWDEVLADARPARHWPIDSRRRRVSIAAAAALAVAALVGVLPALAGDGYYWSAQATRTCDQTLIDTLGHAYTSFPRSLLPAGYRPTAPIPNLPNFFHAPGHLGTELGVERQSTSGVWDANSAADLEYDIFPTRAAAIAYWKRYVIPLRHAPGIGRGKPAQGFPQPALSFRFPGVGFLLAMPGKVMVTTETRDGTIATARPLERSAPLAYLRVTIRDIHKTRPTCRAAP